MIKKKSYVILGLLFSILLSVGFFSIFVASGKNYSGNLIKSNVVLANDYEYIFFWGVGCPHCDILKDEIEEYGWDEYLDFDYREIYNVPANRNLFVEKLRECGIPSQQGGVPMLYSDGKCFMGGDVARQEVVTRLRSLGLDEIKGISENIGSSSSEDGAEFLDNSVEADSIRNNNGDDGRDKTSEYENKVIDGKKNTEIMLILIFLFLVGLVGFGYIIRNSKGSSDKGVSLKNSVRKSRKKKSGSKNSKNKPGKKKKKFKGVAIFAFATISVSLLRLFIFASKANAICPVCTAAVGAGLGLSSYFGIDDVITSLWIGGVVLSMTLTTADLIINKTKLQNKIVANFISGLIFYGLLFTTLHFMDVTGDPFNIMWGIDSVVLGTVVGSLAFLMGAIVHFELKKRNDDESAIPFQKVVIPVGFLWLASLIFYAIVY